MSLNCDIVKDMVVLYKDDCINENTKAQIDEHLCECKSCRKYYKSYENLLCDEQSAFVSEPERIETNKDFGKLAKRLRIKSLIRDIVFSAAILASVFITLAVAKNIWNDKSGK